MKSSGVILLITTTTSTQVMEGMPKTLLGRIKGGKATRASLTMVLVAVLTCLWAVCTQAAIQYKVVDLGTIGGDSSSASAINDSGQIVGWSEYIPGDWVYHATIFDYTREGYNLDLGTLGGNCSRAECLNNIGQIIGWAGTSQGNGKHERATLFDPTGSGNNLSLGTLGATRSGANSINNLGQIVGSHYRGQAILFGAIGSDNNIPLGTLGGWYSGALSINDAGQIVGVAMNTHELWRATLFDCTETGNNIDLGTLGGDCSYAKSINDVGQVVGEAEYESGSEFTHATIFDVSGAGNNIDIGTLGGSVSVANSINAAGQIIGCAQDSQGRSRATLFDPTGAGNNFDLNTLIDPVSGWTLVSANDINKSGWIVGDGINPYGESHAFLLVPISTKYSGGSGTPEDPYQIATAQDLILLGETPEDYDKHFIMTADIDLSGYTYDRAVIAPDVNDVEGQRGINPFEGKPFSGVFDGNNHSISHLRIKGASYLGLFGQIGSGAIISNLGVDDLDIHGTGNVVGGFAGNNNGTITKSYSSGSVSGDEQVGGLVGFNGFLHPGSALWLDKGGIVLNSHSSARVDGESGVGGLVGLNMGHISASHSIGSVNGNRDVGGLTGINGDKITLSFSTSAVSGSLNVGGLVGNNGFLDRQYVYGGNISLSYSEGEVSGADSTGGLVGENPGDIYDCYSSGRVSGNQFVGGLVGKNFWHSVWFFDPGLISTSYSVGSVSGSQYVGGLVGYRNLSDVNQSFWDMETSGQTTSDGGTGLITVEMQTHDTFLNASWDFTDEIQNGTHDYWQILQGDYPLLRYHIG